MSIVLANRFEIADQQKDLLGCGGMGEVYRATDNQTGEIVAVKSLNPDILSHSPELLDRFRREGEALRQLNHPNIVHMLAAIEEGGAPYLVMEFVGGGSLEEKLQKQGRIDPAEVIKLGLEIADALARAHHLGILHRDIKPSNVLLAADGTPRLSDFGIAYQMGSQRLTQAGALVGTPDYICPELLQGRLPDELSDIWAFGVMLFEMMSGQLPFQGGNLAEKITAILNQPVPDLAQRVPEASQALVNLVYSMLEKDCKQRVPSVRMVGAELEAIQKGRWRPGVKPASHAEVQPVFEKIEVQPVFEKTMDTEQAVFVTRDHELAQLFHQLELALDGHGRVALITGDSGQGKTSLAQAFAWRAHQAHTDLVIAGGNCNAYTGMGDPYLPFREIMAHLTGDVETGWVIRSDRQEQQRRLGHLLPSAVQAFVETGPDLIDVFVGGTTIIHRVKSAMPSSEAASWLPRLEQLVDHKRSLASVSDLKQAAIFEQYRRMMGSLAARQPLLLFLDDLQWADSGSINLLFHLVRGIQNSRILVIGAYRPSDLSQGRAGEQHPLVPILNEFKSMYGAIEIDLRQAEGQEFVNAFLDTEPNRLGSAFRQTLFQQTGGHPLATIEMLRDLQENGGLVKDQEGYWNQGPNLAWDTLPVRVEAMIAQRIERLDAEERRIMQVASVEGEVFTSEVAARVLSVNEREIVRALSGDLERVHHLVRGHGTHYLDGKRLSSYRFQHILFQRYLYTSLDPVERVQIHQDVASALEVLYRDKREEIAVQLARHYKEAGIEEKAAIYLDQAGDQARVLFAPEEAVESYQQAMSAYQNLLGEHWDPFQRAELEYKIGESLYLKGDYRLATDHLEKSADFYGITFRHTIWGTRWTILSEAIRQLRHRLLPRLLIKPVGAPLNTASIAWERSLVLIGGIAITEDVEKFLLVSLIILNRSEQMGYPNGIARGAAALAMVFNFLYLYRFASIYQRIAASVAEKMENPNERGKGDTFFAFQGHYLFQGKWAGSIEYGEQACRIYKENGEMHHWATSAFWLVSAKAYLGKYSEALRGAQEIIEVGVERVDPEIKSYGLTMRGYVLQRMGQNEDAILASLEAGQLTEAVPDYAWCIMAYADVGRAYLRQGLLNQGLEMLDKSQNFFAPNLGGDSYASLFNGKAEAYLKMAEQSAGRERIQWLKKAAQACRVALKQESQFRPGHPEALRLQGTYLWLMGKELSARKWWQRSLDLAEELDQQYDLGMAHLEIGQRIGSRPDLEHAVRILGAIGAVLDLKRAQEALKGRSVS